MRVGGLQAFIWFIFLPSDADSCVGALADGGEPTGLLELFICISEAPGGNQSSRRARRCRGERRRLRDGCSLDWSHPECLCCEVTLHLSGSLLLFATWSLFLSVLFFVFSSPPPSCETLQSCPKQSALIGSSLGGGTGWIGLPGDLPKSQLIES